MRKIIFLIFISFMICSCKAVKSDSRNTKPESVSLISLIANPEKFHKKTIIVEGYLILESEGDAIYVSKDDCVNMIQKNGVFLFADYKELSEMGIKSHFEGYVKLEGVFNKDIKGSYDFYSGTFEKINTVSILHKRGSKD